RPRCKPSRGWPPLPRRWPAPRPRASGGGPEGRPLPPGPAVRLEPAEGVLGPARRRPVLQPDVTGVAPASQVLKEEPVVDLAGTGLAPARHVRDLDVADQL